MSLAKKRNMIRIRTMAGRDILLAAVVMGVMVLGLSVSVQAADLHISLIADLSAAAMLGASQETADFFISPQGH